MKKVLKVIICFLCLFIIVGCTEEKTKKSINVIILDNKSNELYNKNIKTYNSKLVDILENEKVSLKIEDGPYGAYIISLMGLEQKNDNDGMYYWSYYINDEYANVGISNCKIKDGDTYKFVYEFYKN